MRSFLITLLVFSCCLICSFSLVSCTDATMASYGSLGNEHRITLYSGGVKVASWISTGKVLSGEQNQRWAFVDKATKRYIRVTGDVVVETLDGSNNTIDNKAEQE